MPIWTLLPLLIFAGLLVYVLLISRGFAATDSRLAGLTIAAASWLFAGIGLLAAQLYEDTGSTLGVVFALLFSSLIPMVLNKCPSVYHMLFHPYAISSRRDLEAGLFQSKPGPAEAAPGLSNPLGLAWRQHKNTIINWTIGMIFIGGSVRHTLFKEILI